MKYKILITIVSQPAMNDGGRSTAMQVLEHDTKQQADEVYEILTDDSIVSMIDVVRTVEKLYPAYDD